MPLFLYHQSVDSSVILSPPIFVSHPSFCLSAIPPRPFSLPPASLLFHHAPFLFPSVSLSVYHSIASLCLFHSSTRPSNPSRPSSFPARQSVCHSTTPIFLSCLSVCPSAIPLPHLSFPIRQSVRLPFHHTPFPFQPICLSVSHSMSPFPFHIQSLSVCNSSTPVFLSCLSSLRLSFYHARFLSCPSVCPSVILSRPIPFPTCQSVRLIFYYAFPFPAGQSVCLLFHHTLSIPTSDPSVCQPFISSHPITFPLVSPYFIYSLTPLSISHPLVCPSAILSRQNVCVFFFNYCTLNVCNFLQVFFNDVKYFCESSLNTRLD